MSGKRAFSSYYRKLNAKQRAAVDTIEGPVMVVAGPGTGKTQILSLRIANILRKTDTPPDGILALTFTDAGVAAMRRRLVEMIGSDAYRVGIYTFHGFASELIGEYPDEYPRIVGSRMLTDIDTVLLLKEIIEGTTLKRLKPFNHPLYYLPHIRSAISELKREHITPKEARRRAREERARFNRTPDRVHERGPYRGRLKGVFAAWEKQIEKNAELARVYERYEKVLRARKRYDYEDMIVETLEALERNPDFLLALQERYLYMLADEHQDANHSQNEFLERLAGFHESPNLFLVGDTKQAIYRFQGASRENFLRMKERFPDMTVIHLSENYRSTQAILSAAHTLISQGDLSELEENGELRGARTGKAEPPRFLSFSEPAFSYAYLADDIRRRLDEGVPAEEIAVLYRNNRDAEALLPALERQNVPYTVESDQSVLLDLDIRAFVMVLTAIEHFGSDEKLAPVLHLGFINLDPLNVYRLLRARTRLHCSLYELLASRASLKRSGITDAKEMRAFYTKLVSWHRFAKNRSVLDTIETVARESGFWGHLISHEEAQEKLDMFNGFVRDIEQLLEAHPEYILHDILHHIALLEEYHITMRRTRRFSRGGAIRLMTAHRAKGLEFDYVYLPDVTMGHWGNQRTVRHFTLTEGAEEHELLDDERRLFYVALTRARLGVTLLHGETGPLGRAQLPAQFVEEIDDTYLAREDMSAYEKQLKPETLLAPRARRELSVTEHDYLRTLFREQGLSVTALNNYLADPWKYFFENLLRIPKAPQTSMLYGSAMHDALHDLSARLIEGKRAGKSYLLARFAEHLAHAPMREHDYKRSLTKGKKALTQYFDTYRDEMHAPLGTELSITVPFRVGTEGEVILRGVLDRVDLIPGSDREVHVMDYKTGKVRSRNDIMGKTKTSTGDYWRQLVFYKLLLSRYRDGAYRMVTGVIDFLEPDERGRHRREVFDISDTDVEALETVIQRVAEEILSLAFWDTPCDPKSPWSTLHKILFNNH